MKAVRFYGVGDLRLEDIEKPDILADQVLVSIIYSGICGSDLHIYRKGMFMTYIPETLGHEFIGIIEQVGRDVQEYKVGDMVIADPRVPCGKCLNCENGCHNVCPTLGFIGEVSPGSFAQYIAVPQEKLIKVNHKANLQQMALAEPLAVALHICENGQLKENDILAIIGAGPIGVLTVLIAKTVYGVKNITAIDLSEERLRLAELAGADKIVNNLAEHKGFQYNKIVEAAGNQYTISCALELLAPHGTLLIVGLFEDQINIDPNPIVYKELKIVGNNAYNKQELKKAVEFIESKRVDLGFLISHVYPLDKTKEAFELLKSCKKPVGKILLKPNQEEGR